MADKIQKAYEASKNIDTHVDGSMVYFECIK